MPGFAPVHCLGANGTEAFMEPTRSRATPARNLLWLREEDIDELQPEVVIAQAAKFVARNVAQAASLGGRLRHTASSRVRWHEAAQVPLSDTTNPHDFFARSSSKGNPMNCIQEMPAFHGRNRFHQPFTHLEIADQIQVLLDAHGQENLLRPRTVVSVATRQERALLTRMAVRQLGEGGFQLRSILGVKQKHLEYLTARWVAEGHSPLTLHTRLSHIRWLMAATGKPGFVLDPSAYGIGPRSPLKSLSGSSPTQSANELLDPGALDRVRALDPHVATQFRVIVEFGLSVPEALNLLPDLADEGDGLRVLAATGGKHARKVPIESSSQREALDEAREASRNCSRGTLIPQGVSLKSATNRFYYILRRAGVTGTGITPRVFRTQPRPPAGRKDSDAQPG